MIKKEVAVVILNWNGRKLLEKFLPSVLLYSEEARIYVADNASTDDSIQFLKTHYPSIKIIQNKKNSGYAQGYNEALQYVNEDIFCLLNSDVEVTENWLKPIISKFSQEPEISILQPKILDYNHKDYFEYAGAAGGFIDKYGYPFCRGRIFDTIEQDKGQYDDTTRIFWASGACFFIRKSVFEKLNGFDSSFFAHMEEIDLCWRAHNLGFISKYVGATTVYHVGGATLHASNPRKTYLNFRNSLFTLTKNSPSPLFGVLLIRLLLDGIAGLKFVADLKFKNLWAIIKSHYNFFFRLPELLAKRKILRQESQGKNPPLYYHTTSIVWLYFLKKQRKFRV